MNKISKHVSYKEGVYSTTALRLGLNNEPTDDHLQNMKLLSEKVFEPLRIPVGGPIKINSFYRGPELNAAISIEPIDFFLIFSIFLIISEASYIFSGVPASIQ